MLLWEELWVLQCKDRAQTREQSSPANPATSTDTYLLLGEPHKCHSISLLSPTTPLCSQPSSPARGPLQGHGDSGRHRAEAWGIYRKL